MSRGLADTSVFIAREGGRTLDADAFPDEVAVSVITIGEVRAGVLVAEGRSAGSAARNPHGDPRAGPLPVDEAVAAAWARLRVQLRVTGQRMPVNDSWIAATAMSLKVPVVTQDDDFPDVDGLSVIHV